MSKKGTINVVDRRRDRPSRPPAGRGAKSRARRRKSTRRTRWGWGWVVAFVLVTAVGGVLYQSSRSARETGTVVEPAHALGPGGAEVMGTLAAPVLIEEYGDFQCPACASWDRVVFPTVRRLVEEGKIRFAYHLFAFLGPESLKAASAAECAGDQGKFWEYRDYLYANQYPENSGALTSDRLIEIGDSVGISPASFGSCVRADTYAGWIRQISDQATSRGITSTPTILVNGQALPTPPSPDELVAAVEAALP
jgi:protein-disulfide isomerase